MATQHKEKKEIYEAQVQAQLDKLNAQINEMKAKGEQMKADASIEYQNQLEELCAKRDAVTTKLDELKQSSEDAWSDLQSGFETAWQELSQAVEKAKTKF